MNYRSEIDGLRAVAVVPVILFHADFHYFSGGYVGVDIFFVISGYLITTLLVSELESGKFSLARFYERRVRRILPALFFVMLVCIPFAWFLMLPWQMKDFAESLVAVSLFVSNFLFWSESGYFFPDADLKPLLHTWSLAVEEQYYMFFPIFLAFVWRFGRKFLFGATLFVAIISLCWAEWSWRHYPDANFYLAPSRVWELFAGSLCAFYLTNRLQPASNLLSLTGLFLIGYSLVFFNENTPFPSLWALFPIVGSALIIIYAKTGTWVARLLSTRVFTGIGLISYSVYLWHQPVFAFARIHYLGYAVDARAY